MSPRGRTISLNLYMEEESVRGEKQNNGSDLFLPDKLFIFTVADILFGE